MTNDPHQEAWAHYWSGTSHDQTRCLPNAPAEIAGLFTAKWQDFFQGLPVQAAVLDLGTGGGAVLNLARELRPDLEFCGVDYASDLPAIGGVTMMGGVRLEKLPFEEDSFDAVTSQFALEYAEVEHAVAELLRVLKRGGALMLVLHHPDSFIIEHNSRRLAALDDLLAPQGLISLVEGCIRSGQVDSRDARLALSETFIALRKKHNGQSIIMDAGMITARQMTSAQGAAEVAHYRRRLELEQRRLHAMKAAALPKPAVERLLATLAAKFTANLSLITQGGSHAPLAWCITNTHRE